MLSNTSETSGNACQDCGTLRDSGFLPTSPYGCVWLWSPRSLPFRSLPLFTYMFGDFPLLGADFFIHVTFDDRADKDVKMRSPGFKGRQSCDLLIPGVAPNSSVLADPSVRLRFGAPRGWEPVSTVPACQPVICTIEGGYTLLFKTPISKLLVLWT